MQIHEIFHHNFPLFSPFSPDFSLSWEFLRILLTSLTFRKLTFSHFLLQLYKQFLFCFDQKFLCSCCEFFHRTMNFSSDNTQFWLSRSLFCLSKIQKFSFLSQKWKKYIFRWKEEMICTRLKTKRNEETVVLDSRAKKAWFSTIVFERAIFFVVSKDQVVSRPKVKYKIFYFSWYFTSRNRESILKRFYFGKIRKNKNNMQKFSKSNGKQLNWTLGNLLCGIILRRVKHSQERTFFLWHFEQ